jgi:hypothetical protein
MSITVMHRLLAGFFVIALVFAGGYWYRFAESKCNVPIAYDIGELDDRFDITRDEARAAISDAESLWEDATGQNLFTYQSDAVFKINFIYDNRQEKTEEEGELREILSDKEEVSEHIRDEYERLLDEYEELKDSYEDRVDAYEASLRAYNDEVEEWNKKGGAPESVFADLERIKDRLDAENKELNGIARELNKLVAAINNLGETGNRVVREYNEDVEWYNTIFGGEREFTQGDYQGDEINIYQFRDRDEPKRVLAHEFGHALSLGHVENDHSIMYYLMEGKLANFALSDTDVAEFRRVCGAE